MTTVASALRSNLSRGWDIFADKGISTHVPYFAPIENGIIRLKNDCLVTTLRLNGFSFETADIDYVNLLQRQRNTAFRAISNLGSFALYTHVVRHKVRPSLPGTFADPFMARMDEVYQASISKNEMFVNDTYVSLVVRPVFRICPQLGTVMSPSPRKLIVDSVRMALATPKAAFTSTGPSAFGRISRKMIVRSA